MRAICPARLLVTAEVEPGLMHQGGGLQCLTGRFVSHFVRRHPSQFVIDKRKQLISGFRVAVPDGVQDSGDFTHADPGSQQILPQARKPKDEVFESMVPPSFRTLSSYFIRSLCRATLSPTRRIAFTLTINSPSINHQIGTAWDALGTVLGRLETSATRRHESVP